MNQKLEQKEKSHAAILASAAALLRERGIRASSVGDVMRGAGLTVGGFYGHFESKEQLFTETVRATARATWNRLLSAAKGETPRERTLSVVGRYLSRTHRDQPEDGCFLPSATAEIAREGEPYKSALEAELSHFARSLSALVEGDERREKALGLIALMVGALSLARAVRGTALSDDILRAAKKLAERSLASEASNGD